MTCLPWTSEHIQKALRIRGWTQRSLAQELGISASAVSYGLRMGSSVRLCSRVAEILGETPQVLWPERFPPQWQDSELPP
jgi:lambda repressor-like predicted transcriptional regulator